MGFDKDLVTREGTSVYSKQDGGLANGGLEQRIHYQDVSRGRSDVIIETIQDESKILKLNQQRRNTEQGGWGEMIGKMEADIPLVAVERWKTNYGFDLRTANLNDPSQYATFKRLLMLNPQYKTYDGNA